MQPLGQGGMPSGGGAMQPFDFFGGGGLFGGRDPFAGFGDFGSMGVGGAMGKPFDEMARHLGQGSAMAGPGGGCGSGQYQSHSFAMSSVMGPDGKMHTEKFSSADRGHIGQKIRESQQAYSNSTTGVDKMGLERQIGERAHKMVKERDRTREERSTEMFRGMDERGRDAFDRDFGGKSHHMPAYQRVDPGMLAAGMPCSRRELGPAGPAGGNVRTPRSIAGSSAGSVTTQRRR